MDTHLSVELLRYSDELDADFIEDIPPEEKEDFEEFLPFLEKLTEWVIEARQKISANEIDKVRAFTEEIPGAISEQLDRSYTRAALQQIPERVRRTLQLAELMASNSPSDQTQRYISESARAYILGLPMSCVAMARAALEQAIKERLGWQGRGEYITLDPLIREAMKWNILSKTGAEAAKGLVKKCDLVMHERPLDEPTSFEVFVGIRSLLEEIYNSSGSY